MLEIGINKIYGAQSYEIDQSDIEFPKNLKTLPEPPEKLYLVGNPRALRPGIAVIGARRATPYGIDCVRHFAGMAAKYGINIISGGAYGCDSAAHRAAIFQKSTTVVFLGGGCNNVYPPRNLNMYKQVIQCGGAIVSENPWDFKPLKFTFLNRNRLIAGLSNVVLIAEAGLPSGTFSTADWAIKYGKEVWAVPGPISYEGSSGCNKLIYDGAVPIINDAVFMEHLNETFKGVLKKDVEKEVTKFENARHKNGSQNPVIEAILAQPMRPEALFEIARHNCGAKDVSVWLSKVLINAENQGIIAKYPNGMYGAKLKEKT